jgi:hypothetical protein
MSLLMQPDQPAQEATTLDEETPPLSSPEFFKYPGINFRWINAAVELAIANLLFWPRIRRILDKGPEPYPPHPVHDEFFGINIAPGPNPASNKYLLTRLDELGLMSVRLNLGYDPEDRENAAQLIDQLHASGHRILLQLLQPPADALRMGKTTPDTEWRTFLIEILKRFGDKVEAVEIGSTINRFGWSGYTIKSYARASRIAQEVCREHDVKWYGGNVSDFAPFFNIGTLAGLRRARCLPDAHTDNLLTDRSGQPENHDSHLLPFSSERLRIDLVGKLRVLSLIGRHYGVTCFISTYAYWTLKLKPESRKIRYVTPDSAARYLARYFILSAASGYVDRVYWGQLVSHWKGLIDDGTTYKPRVPMVYGHRRMGGVLDDYTIRPGFHSFRQVIQVLKNTIFLKRVPTIDGTYLFEFERSKEGDGPRERVLVGWTRDGMADHLERYLGTNLGGVLRIEDLEGRPLEKADALLGPAPIYLFGAKIPEQTLAADPSLDHLRQLKIPRGVDEPYLLRHCGKWRLLIRRDLLTPEFKKAMEDPELLFNHEGAKNIKSSKRGRLSELCLESQGSDREKQDLPVMLKRMNPRAHVSDRTQSRAAKAWNNSCNILQRGVRAPLPLILIDHLEQPAQQPSYLVVENLTDHLPIRELLNAVRADKPLSLEIDRGEFLRQLACFVRDIHKNGIYHRDLTGGNILIARDVDQTDSGPRLRFALIDVARSRFYRHVSLLNCHRDLSRVRVPGGDRHAFYHHYQNCPKTQKRRRRIHYRIVHGLYRAKYNLKNPGRLLRALRR